MKIKSLSDARYKKQLSSQKLMGHRKSRVETEPDSLFEPRLSSLQGIQSCFNYLVMMGPSIFKNPTCLI